MTYRGAILSVGGSADPIIYSLNLHRPEFVLFFVSTQSRVKLDGDILPRLEYAPQYSCAEVSEPGNVGHCYEGLQRRVPEWLNERRLEHNAVYVDITGGTKPMSAALLMFASEWCSHFTYISGSQRDKEGLGVVLTGSEQMFEGTNLLERLAVRGRERGLWLFNRFYAESAAQIFRDSAQKCDPALGAKLGLFADLADLFAASDRFRFRGLYQKYRRVREKLEQALQGDQRPLFEEVERLADHWKAVEEETKCSNRISSLLGEMLANAERRGQQGSYDDAVARLYRSTEMFIQLKLHEAFGARLGKMGLDQVPEDGRVRFRQEFSGQESEEAQTYRLGIQLGLKALQFSRDVAHRDLLGRYEANIASHLQKRNDSILAHGLRPVDKGDFDAFWTSLLPFLGVESTKIPRWPCLKLDVESTSVFGWRSQ